MNDQEALERFNNRLQLVRDRVRSVAEGWATGLYLWGSGGISKSYTVTQELDRLKTPYKLTNSRLTGRGLVDLLQDYPSHVHLLEDMERMCLDANAAGILRSACWTTREQSKKQHPERLVTWRAFKTIIEFTFTGGIIFCQNAKLDNLPELAALKTRVAHLHLCPTAQEVIAKMRDIARQGYSKGKHSMTVPECHQVCEHLIAKCQETARNPDLRMLTHAFNDYLQWDAGQSETGWEDMLQSRLQEQVTAPERAECRFERLAREQALAAEISLMNLTGKEKEALWQKKTGRSARALYRRLEDLPR